ncbi:DEAD/DEAH box helicase [Halobacillus sp. Marseille-P3879]|uniref:DEAD/DEAH box helicase n=1 Tax=Halobacillus sp. Marseille-P3879 TaxID=2045014 RepID=UPI000C7C5C1A|nr:helicase-related protein [Halobacillus sp. Marseille-P3879]
MKLFRKPSSSFSPYFSPFSEDSPHQHLAGKLLTRSEITLKESELTQLRKNLLVQIVSSITGRQCQRCGVRQSYFLCCFPHSVCQKECCFCRNCIMMGRVTECEPLYLFSPLASFKKHASPCRWKGDLTPGQQAAADRIISSIHKREELLVWAVCGAGKTEMLFPGLTHALKQGMRICLATPRTDVVRELVPRLRSAFPDVEIEALYGDSEDKMGSAQLLLSTTHQLYRYAGAFDVMIIDEIDAFPFHNDNSLKWAAARAAKVEAAKIYLTATPRKKEKRRIKNKQLPAVFIPSRFHGHPLPVPKLKLTPTLRSQLSKASLPKSVLNSISIQQKGRRQLLLFASTISYAEKIARLLSSDYSIDSVHAEDPERADKIESFRKRELEVLVTTTILERGVTFPSVDVFVIDAGHHVFDEAALVQIAGRAGRSPEDPTGEVIFFHIGKTDAMLEAQTAIEKMNRKAKKL